MAGGIAAAAPMLAQPEKPRLVPSEIPHTIEFVVPPGIYTSFVFANMYDGPVKLTLDSSAGSMTIVADKGTVVVPCGAGLQLGQQGAVICRGTTDMIFASGMTTTGPIAFEEAKKK